MAKARPPIQLAPNVLRVLNGVRRTLRRYVVMQVVLTILCWLVLVFWIGGLIDYLPVRAGSNETPRWVRVGLLITMALGSLWVLLFWGFPRFAAKIKNRSIALLIEKHYPSLNNELITAVELSDRGAAPADVSDAAAHRKMLERVHLSLWAQIGEVNPQHLFNWQPIWSLGTAAVLGVSLTVMAMVALPDWFGLWSRRLFSLSAETWPRQAELRADGVQLPLPGFTGQLAAERVTIPFEAGLARIPKGAAVLLKISAEANEKVVPDVCTLFYRTEEGARGRANLRRLGKPSDGWQQFALDGPPLDGIVADMQLDVIGLDSRLRNLKLETVESAVIMQMKLDCTYPRYLLAASNGMLNPVLRPANESLPYRSGIQIPQGTSVTLVGEANTPLSEVQYVIRAVGDSTGVPGDEAVDLASSIQTAVPSGKEFKIELGRLSSSQVVEVRLFDEFGLCSEQIPRYVLAVQADSTPEVATQLVGIGGSITPKAVVPITGLVTDDNAIAAVNLEIARSDHPVLQIPLQLIDGEVLDQPVDLIVLAEQNSFQVEPGESIGLVVTAQDFFDLDNEVHVGRGQPQLLSVVTDDELLVILDRQELELRQRLERIMTELVELREVLQLLSSRENLGTAGQVATRNQLVSPQDDDQQRRLLVFRAQQSVLQGDKSEQELSGVADRIENVRLQLENNRIDSYDRQTRLREKVFLPLSELLNNEFKSLSRHLLETQTATMSGDGSQQAISAISSLDSVLIKLEGIRDSMLDIESFNEIVELVRSLLDDQDNLIDETEEAQKKRILELLK